MFPNKAGDHSRAGSPTNGTRLQHLAESVIPSVLVVYEPPALHSVLDHKVYRTQAAPGPRVELISTFPGSVTHLDHIDLPLNFSEREPDKDVNEFPGHLDSAIRCASSFVPAAHLEIRPLRGSLNYLIGFQMKQHMNKGAKDAS